MPELIDTANSVANAEKAVHNVRMVNPKGRPAKLKANERRTTAAQITVRLNEAERATLERLALAFRCSNGEVLRRGMQLLAERAL